ncbi:MAG: hypothetical protein K2I13_08315, partial [Alistipes sp.]|nr:hypothetical protein [Alistipes sp.]
MGEAKVREVERKSKRSLHFPQKQPDTTERCLPRFSTNGSGGGRNLKNCWIRCAPNLRLSEAEPYAERKDVGVESHVPRKNRGELRR